jgi:hypothetical protein
MEEWAAGKPDREEGTLKDTANDQRSVQLHEGLDVSKLSLTNVDLHFHAGCERHANTSMDDYLDFAYKTGRIVIGVTDHFGLYHPGGDWSGRPYEGSLRGFQRFMSDIDEASARFPMLKLLKCPELRAATLDDHLPEEAVQASDFFLCEPPGVERGEVERNTALRLDHVRKAASFRESTSRPVLLVHPFRAAVNRRLVKEPIDPRLARSDSAPVRAFTEKDLSDFFMFDLRRYAGVCKQEGIPVEINGNTDSRIRRTNLIVPYRMLIAACALLRDCGVDLVPGSDLHAIRSSVGWSGSYVPWTTLEALRLRPQDSPFVRSLLGQDPSARL